MNAFRTTLGVGEILVGLFFLGLALANADLLALYVVGGFGLGAGVVMVGVEWVDR